METARRLSEVRKLDRQRAHFQILQGIVELPNAVLVGPNSLPDGHDVVVNPKEVPTFGRCRRSDPGEDRNAQSPEHRAHGSLFAPAKWFPHAEEHRALV